MSPVRGRLPGIDSPSWYVLLHLCLVVPLAVVLNIWEDESYTLHTTARGLSTALYQAMHFEYQPPLYFVVLAAWRLLNHGILWARLFSVACTAATVVAGGALWRRYAPGTPARWFLLALALHPFLAWAALEIRCYALAILLCTMAMILFHDAVLVDVPRPRALAGFTLCAVAMLYTQYYTGFLLAALGLAILVQRPSAAWRRLAVAAGTAGLALVPLIPSIGGQAGQGGGPVARAGAADVVRRIWHRAGLYLLPTPSPAPQPMVLAFYAVLAAGTVALLWGWYRRRRAADTGEALVTRTAVAVPAILAILFVPVFAAMPSELTGPRHTSALFVPLALAPFVLFRSAWGHRALPVVAAAMIAFSAATLYLDYRSLAKTGDWRRVANDLEHEAAPGEPVVVFRSTSLLPLAYHYHGLSELRSVTGPVDFTRWRVADFAIRDEDQVAAALSAPRAWLVTDDAEPYMGIDFHRDVLERFVADRCGVLQDRRYRGSRVRLVECRSDRH